MLGRIFTVLLLVLILFSESGCWDRNELEDLGIVSGLGVEEGDNGKTRVIIQTINTAALSKTGGGRGVEFEKAYRNSVVEGDNLYDAINKLTTITATKRNLSHTNLFVISEDLAREKGVKEILDFIGRDPQIRLDSWVIVGRGSLAVLFDVPGRLSTTPASRVSDIIKFRSESFSYAPLRIAEFTRLLESESAQPYTAVVERQPNASYATGKGHGIMEGNVPEPTENLTMNGTAVFRGDKMAGWLNRNESRGLLWLRGEVDGGVISFPVPEKGGGKVVTSILSAKSKLQPEIIKGQLCITAQIEVESYLEQNAAAVKIDQPAEIKKMELAQGNQVKREVRAALKKAQHEYGVDIFGFGEAVHRQYPGEWKQIKSGWADIYPGVEVKVQVKSVIQHTSLTGNAPQSGKR